jgi:hypothetical protein
VRRAGRPDAVLSSSAEEIALEEAAPGGVPRRLATWRLGAPATVLPWQGAGAPRFFAQQGERILELLAGGRACVYAPWDARVDVQGFADLDADGLPEAIGVQTCAYCTSNHVLWRGR